ncbi:hypothetical protein [uncultured Eudoraea sp.]|jgi:hypothetical protein|uniref:hypothetical protein n=1 Tax=uncultured Eudoraea sp. TaxID=1035614 RepID=UPI0026331351|nr:hypothetical protein [uncultured Eudoraea sp.]
MKYSILIVIFLTAVFGSLAQSSECNCCSENHDDFDFWEGKWEVSNKDGTFAGKNTIVKMQGGCVLTENWIGAKGQYTGTSLNFYNDKMGQWEQLWVDNSGSHLKLTGNRIENQMIMKSLPFEHKDGKKYVNKITWTLNKDGTVRQLWEIMNNGTAVNVAFDGLYKKLE